MDASKISFTNETRQSLHNPLLTKTKKRALRKKILEELLTTQPPGKEWHLKDFMGPLHLKTQGSVWSTLKTLEKNKTIKREKAGPFKNSGFNIYWLEGVKTTKLPSVTPTMPDKKTETSNDGVAPPKTVTLDQVILSQVQQEAKDFAWQHNSDSLREFISNLSIRG